MKNNNESQVYEMEKQETNRLSECMGFKLNWSEKEKAIKLLEQEKKNDKVRI